MSQRITGLETEYGCLVASDVALNEVLPLIRDWLFHNDRYTEDYDEWNAKTG